MADEIIQKKNWQVECKNCGTKIKAPAMVRGQFISEELGIKFDIDFSTMKDEYTYVNDSISGHQIKIETKGFSWQFMCPNCKKNIFYNMNEIKNVD